MAKHVIRYRNSLMGWNPSNDSEWRYRETLEKSERDEFDGLDERDRRLIVDAWMAIQAGFKF